MPPARILIVDDEPAVTNALSPLFAQAGFEIAVARTGPEALSHLAWKPDLVILDVRLPERTASRSAGGSADRPPTSPS